MSDKRITEDQIAKVKADHAGKDLHLWSHPSDEVGDFVYRPLTHLEAAAMVNSSDDGAKWDRMIERIERLIVWPPLPEFQRRLERYPMIAGGLTEAISATAGACETVRAKKL